MTKENIYKSYLEDQLLTEKKYITQDQAASLKFADTTKVKLLNIIKIGINGIVDKDGDGVIARKINQFLNTEKL